MPRLKKFGKNRYKGNQFETNSDPKSKVSSLLASSFSPSPSLDRPRPTTPDEVSDELNQSSSQKKLYHVKLCAEDSEYLPERNTSGNIIVDLELLNINLLAYVKCVECDTSNSIGICEKPSLRKGLAVKLILFCKHCGFEKDFYSSKKTTSNAFDVNVRCVYGLRSVGKGKAAAETLCAVMDLPKPPSRFQYYNKIISKAAEETAESSMIEAARGAVIENDGSIDIAACFDGSWQKRGHTSLNGVFTVTSMDTGKVLDCVCLSKYCSCSSKLKNSGGKKHSENCSKNYDGSSGGMEVAAATQVFQRSLSRGVRYIKYLGDGDSNAFSAVVQSKPYGDLVISKLECVGHVQKRMGSRLRRLKNKMRGKKLADGKTLGGKGRLTDAVIDSMQVYYGKAIRENTDDVEKMISAVWAIYLHKISMDDKPRHELCPKGENSWCGYQRALVTGEEYSHKHSVPEDVMKELKTIFRDLTSKELLKKCVHGRTQNFNESLNNVIWTRIPKNTFVGLSTLKLGVMDAIITFNLGALGKVKVLEKLCSVAGRNCLLGLKHIDQVRILEANKAIQKENMSKRREKRNLKRKRQDKEEENSNHYGAGNF